MEYYKATAQYHAVKRRAENRVYSLCGISNYVQEKEEPGIYPKTTLFRAARPKVLCSICAQKEKKHNG